MQISNDIPWKRITVEAAAIVVSILLAFAIDAWWDRQGAAARERVVLETLLSDMQDFQSARAVRDGYLEAIMESGRLALDIGKGLKPDVTDREIDFVLNDLTYTSNVVNKGLPVLDLLFEGGDLVTIESDEVRACLADFRFSLSVEVSYGRREVEFVDNLFYPFLDANSSLAQIWGADDGQPGYAPGAAAEFPLGRESVSQSEISHKKLLEDRQFQNLVIRKIMYLENAKGWEDSTYDVDTQLNECIALIESELPD